MQIIGTAQNGNFPFWAVFGMAGNMPELTFFVC